MTGVIASELEQLRSGRNVSQYKKIKKSEERILGLEWYFKKGIYISLTLQHGEYTHKLLVYLQKNIA